MKKVRVGVIGAGSIAKLGHLPYYQKHPDVELVGVADTNEQRAKETAEQFGAKKAYADAEEMLREAKPDAVSICTANHTHVSLALMALRYGADVLVEKPLSLTYEEALSLEAEVKKQNRICMVGMTHRFRNESRALKRFVESGDLGEIYYAKAKILRRRGTPSGWFTDQSKAGGGPLMDIGVHALDLVWWLVGKPKVKSVSGHLVQGIGRYRTEMLSRWQSADQVNQDNEVFDVEDFASAFLRFKNGLVIQLEVSWALNGPQDDALKVEIYGTKGGLSLDPLCFYSEQNQILTDSQLIVQRNDPYQDEIDHFVSAVKNRRTPLIPVEDGVEIMRMLDGIRRSSELQREISLE